MEKEKPFLAKPFKTIPLFGLFLLMACLVYLAFIDSYLSKGLMVFVLFFFFFFTYGEVLQLFTLLSQILMGFLWDAVVYQSLNTFIAPGKH